MPSNAQGSRVDALIHVSDWLPTLLRVATGAPVAPLTDAVSAIIPYDGMSQWNVILGQNDVAMRTEIVLDHCLAGFSVAGTGCNHFGATGNVGALIVGEWKLVVGPNGGEWTSFTNGTKSQAFGGVACDPHCLFNLTDDASEHQDLSAARPDVLVAMLTRFQAFERSYHPPAYNPPADDAGCCAAAKAAGGFLVPWTPTAPPPPPPPLGPCMGGPGSPGWAVHNNTGGGGPDIAHYPAKGLGDAAVDTCRQRCCASAQCVSVVLHADGCYLNGPNGKPAYTRPETVLAYVRRGPS